MDQLNNLKLGQPQGDQFLKLKDTGNLQCGVFSVMLQNLTREIVYEHYVRNKQYRC